MKRDDLSILSAAIDAIANGPDTEAIAHHEECLEAALADIRHFRTPKRNPATDYEMEVHWAVAHANKHYNALLGMAGYRIPEYLREQFEDCMGAE